MDENWKIRRRLGRKVSNGLIYGLYSDAAVSGTIN
jgi:galactokinase/mevalonate kinase-like predicted kinase